MEYFEKRADETVFPFFQLGYEKVARRDIEKRHGDTRQNLGGNVAYKVVLIDERSGVYRHDHNSANQPENVYAAISVFTHNYPLHSPFMPSPSLISFTSLISSGETAFISLILEKRSGVLKITLNHLTT